MRISFNFLIAILFSITGMFLAMPVSANALSGVSSIQTRGVVARPTRLVIPSIGMNAVVQGVGVTAKGAMAVPSGTTKKVGWYKYGVVPGEAGSAVIDAHVFAAFSKLKYLKPGADVYVITANNTTLHFVVTVAQTFSLSTLSPRQLFRPTVTSDLNLITCAGFLTPNHSTYDHRLVVYTTLVG